MWWVYNTKTTLRTSCFANFFKQFSYYNGTNPLWWYKHAVIQTHFVDINFYMADSSRKKDDFKNPTKIFFKRMQKSAIEFIQGTVAVPKKITDWTSEVMEERINVTRIVLLPGQGLTVYFMVSDDTLLDVVVTPRRRPHYEDFVNAKTISKKKNFYYYPASDFSEKSFYFVGILPNKKMLERQFRSMPDNDTVIINYQVGYELPNCLSWVFAARKWDDSSHCKVTKHLHHHFFFYQYALGRCSWWS